MTLTESGKPQRDTQSALTHVEPLPRAAAAPAAGDPASNAGQRGARSSGFAVPAPRPALCPPLLSQSDYCRKCGFARGREVFSTYRHRHQR